MELAALGFMRFLTVTLAFSFAGCRTASLPSEIGVPLVEGVARSVEDQRSMPQYLVPVDSLTATLLGSYARDHGITLGRPPDALLCPWSKRAGPTGYTVQITINSVCKNDARGVFSRELFCP